MKGEHEMATDKSVQNQKVFITLASVLEFQERYLRIAAQCEEEKKNNRPNGIQIDRKRAYEDVIDLLGLPINKHGMR
jgi:hypothetical protein